MLASLFKKKNELPLSLPKHWPNPSDEDLDENKSRKISVGGSQKYHFNNNFVKTSKYERYNFLPKFLLEEFNPRTKVANCYFFLISAFQTIPEISNTNGLPTTLLPLSMVVLIDGIFQALEDIARHKADEDANSSLTLKYNKITKEFEQVKWSEVYVGDIIEIKTRTTIPCDTLVLATAEKSEPAQGKYIIYIVRN
jgi:magnesium-transporting ATPase (P-type)